MLTSTAITTLVALTAIAVATGILLLAYLDHPVAAPWVKRRLGHKVARLRLSSMLSRQNVLLEEYLDVTPAQDVEEHIAACRRCGNRQSCDELLSQGGAADISICPNADDIRQVKSAVRFWKFGRPA